MKKTFDVIRDCVEIYIPIISFCIMFFVFILQVFCRYILNYPLPWAYEITVSCYLWMVVLSACYVQREKAHVSFTLVYDKLSIKGKALCSFIGNVLVSIAFGVSIIPTIKYIDFMKVQETSVFHIGLNIIYAPYILFVIIIFIYAVTDLYRDFMIFTGKANQEEVDKLLNEGKSEAQEAIDAAVGQEDK